MKMAESEEEGMEDIFDDEAEIDDRAHEKLLSSIFALDGKKRQRDVVRGLPTTSSNVDLVVHAGAKKVKLEDLNLKPKHSQSQLKIPKSDLEIEKAQRQIARESLVSEMTKWDPIVQDIRSAPQTIFSKRPVGIQMYHAVQPKAFTPRTPLEQEIFAALGKSEDVLRPGQKMTVAETKALKAMSIKEAKARRAELMKHQELLSRMELKAKWQNKIKSKRYRKIIRKEKVMAEKKLLEQLQRTDPEAFLDKMDQMEKARMEERLTLKHRGGGKFSRLHKAYSKFDDKTREAVQEMLQKSRELTAKRQEASSSEDEPEDNPDPIKGANNSVNMVSDDEEQVEGRVEANLQEVFKSVRRKAGGWLDVPNPDVVHSQPDTSQDPGGDELRMEAASLSKDDLQSETTSVAAHDESDIICGKALVSESVELEQSLNNHCLMSKTLETCASLVDKVEVCLDKPVPSNSPENDVDEMEAVDLQQGKTSTQDKRKANVPAKRKRKKKKKKKNVDNSIKKDVTIEKAIKEVTLPLVSEQIVGEHDEGDSDGSDQMKVTMEELFQDEDVVEQFSKEVAEAESKNRPNLRDTKLPGWGKWAGPDYQQVPRKDRMKKRLIGRNKKRQVVKQPTVWLNPDRDVAVRKFQLKKVPFPYTTVQQYEATLRQPVSRGFVRETAFKLLTKPEVVTKLGHIITPLDKDDHFRNEELTGSDEEGGLKGQSQDKQVHRKKIH